MSILRNENSICGVSFSFPHSVTQYVQTIKVISSLCSLLLCQDLHLLPSSDISRYYAYLIRFLCSWVSEASLPTVLVWESTRGWTCMFLPSQNNSETQLWVHIGISRRHRHFVKEVRILRSNRCNWIPRAWTGCSSAQSNTHIRSLECIF